MKYPINMNDVQLVAFRRGSGPGGQHKNKTATSIRATHVPTGVVVVATSERSQHANKENAIRLLQAKLDKMLDDRILTAKRDIYGSKPESSFSSQIRTYRLCGNVQGVIDHRTGFFHPNTREVLGGDIDGFIFAQMKNS